MIYLIHFDTPYKHAKHYLGYCQPGGLDARIAKHKKGTGARLMSVIVKERIGFHISRLWPDGDRTLERKLKNLKATPRLCPTCNPSAMKRTKEASYAIEPEKVGSSRNVTTGWAPDTSEESGQRYLSVSDGNDAGRDGTVPPIVHAIPTGDTTRIPDGTE